MRKILALVELVDQPVQLRTTPAAPPRADAWPPPLPMPAALPSGWLLASLWWFLWPLVLYSLQPPAAAAD